MTKNKNMIDENGSFIGFLEDEYKDSVSDPLFLDALKIFCNNNKIKTVVDLGCGVGQYINGLNAYGIESTGYDGNKNIEDITDNIKYIDLSKPINIKKTDLVISIEVGEHIPKKHEATFIENITKSSLKYIIISWAHPGQRGLGHVNCRDGEYIIEQISSRGFKFLDTITYSLRDKSDKWFLKKNLLCFKRIDGENYNVF